MNIRFLVTLTLFFISTCALSAYANSLHIFKPYVGVQLGKASIYRITDNFPLSNASCDCYAGHLYAGVDLMRYFSIETGYTYFTQKDYEEVIQINNNGIAEVWKSHILFRQQSIDLVGKISSPLFYGFGVYAKGGAAIVLRNVNTKSNGEILPHKKEDTDNCVYPTASVGINYYFTPKLSSDIFFTQIFPSKNVFSAQTEFYGVGISYKF